MRILTYPHDLALGGSQLNAIELSAALRDRGHEVVVYGRPGALVDTVRSLGLEFLTAPDPGRRPSPRVARDLAGLVRERRIDVLHGYEWPPGLECNLAGRLSGALSMTTVMSMSVAPFLPRSMPVVVGTEQIADAERRAGRHRVRVLEPPVDVVANQPDDALGRDFRVRQGIGDDFTVVCVSRLAHQLKLEGILTAIDAVGRLAAAAPVRLVVVGDGPARAEVERRADLVNVRTGRPVVVLPGAIDDPRPAYAAADVVLGMGGSALRAAAFGKPLVVQGEGGFFRLLTPESLPDFLWTGWYGYGGADRPPVDLLADLLAGLAVDESRRRDLGRFSRAVVEQRFALTEAAARQEAIYDAALRERRRGADRAWTTLAADGAAAGRFADYHLRRCLARLRGRRAADDFNAQPLARRVDGSGERRPEPGRDGAALLYFAGAPWSAVTGTDKHLAGELARTRDVIWIDPPMSWRARRRRGLQVPLVTEPIPGLVRVSTSCVPGVSRPVLRRLTRLHADLDARRVVRDRGVAIAGVVVSDPEQRFPRWVDAPRVYFETDDFVAGAELLGRSAGYARACRRRNVADCDVVVAVTQDLVDVLAAGRRPGLVLPNGTDAEHYGDVARIVAAPEVLLAGPIAGVVGQLNERLDLGSLDAVAATGASLLLVGPRYEECPETRARLDALIARPNVQWIDRQPFERLPEFMAALAVGLTPYAVTDFNRASFPLKTLEYLAAGRPAVSTDLPAARALETDLVELVTTPQEFASRTLALLSAPPDEALVARRQAFARQHSWAERARRLEQIVALAGSGPGTDREGDR
ncbi:glycosyltransferase [Nocardioides soli]|uniref:Glycosyltransferase involved in cell wall biosynthesis n=1 Tax=Nocardioides soli TaxID=1036020 RepID=A0A7W4Z0I5_9ACTN|nr:glycosyltransferase involved in cell wall biosynthesis [Nocardioides soli]